MPSVGEGNNPNAVGYIADANYSALVVDYHENQFLKQLNQENRIRLDDSISKLSSVPTNPLAFDRYLYSFNNPVRYNDPSGHNPILLALAAIGPAGWVALGVLTVGAVVYFAAGGPEAIAESLTPSLDAMTESVKENLAVAAEGLATISQKNLLPKTGAFPYNPPKQKGNPATVPVKGGGFKDADGNIWRRDKSGHGGPHWDVEHPDGSHTNVNDDGSIR